MKTIEVTEMRFDGQVVKMPVGLKKLLSNPNLWSKEIVEMPKGYKRTVIKENGRFSTLYTKE